MARFVTVSQAAFTERAKLGAQTALKRHRCQSPGERGSGHPLHEDSPAFWHPSCWTLCNALSSRPPVPAGHGAASCFPAHRAQLREAARSPAKAFPSTWTLCDRRLHQCLLCFAWKRISTQRPCSVSLASPYPKYQHRVLLTMQVNASKSDHSL